jgi:hypothetical protein
MARLQVARGGDGLHLQGSCEYIVQAAPDSLQGLVAIYMAAQIADKISH